MKKLLAIMALLLISTGAMAQVTDNELKSEIADIEGSYVVNNGICISQRATYNYPKEELKQRIYSKYNVCNIEENNNVIVVKGNLDKARSDVFIDLNELQYTPNYILEIVLSDSTVNTTLCVNQLISELDRFDDNKIMNIYPINNTPVRYGNDGNKARKIMTNEGYIFCNIVKQMVKFIGAHNASLALIDITNVNDFEIITKINADITTDIAVTNETLISNDIVIKKQINKYANVSLIGESMIIGGAVISLASAGIASKNLDINNPDKGKAGIIIGGVIALGGYITKMSAYNNLKRVQIEGTSIIYKF